MRTYSPSPTKEMVPLRTPSLNLDGGPTHCFGGCSSSTPVGRIVTESVVGSTAAVATGAEAS